MHLGVDFPISRYEGYAFSYHSQLPIDCLQFSSKLPRFLKIILSKQSKVVTETSFISGLGFSNWKKKNIHMNTHREWNTVAELP